MEGDEKLYLNRAICSINIKNFENAKNDIDEALKINPNNMGAKIERERLSKLLTN